MFFFFFQAEDGIRDGHVTGVQTCALPISRRCPSRRTVPSRRATRRSVRSPPSPIAPSTSTLRAESLLRRSCPQAPDGFHSLWTHHAPDGHRLRGLVGTCVDNLRRSSGTSPQAARSAVEMLKKENFAKCAPSLSQSLARVWK